MTYVRQCVDEGIKFAKIIYEKCSQLKKKSHNLLKSPGICDYVCCLLYYLFPVGTSDTFISQANTIDIYIFY
jgi:hypothetical protein